MNSRRTPESDREKFMTAYRAKGPLTLARKIENVFSFLYAEPDGNPCHFDKGLLDEIKAAALLGCSLADAAKDDPSKKMIDHMLDMLGKVTRSESGTRTPEGVDPGLSPCAGTRGANAQQSGGAHTAAVASSDKKGETPRCDALIKRLIDGSVPVPSALANLAEQLERELAEANRDVTNLHECLRQAALQEDLTPSHVAQRNDDVPVDGSESAEHTARMLPCPSCEETDVDATYSLGQKPNGERYVNAGCMVCGTMGPDSHSMQDAVDRWNAMPRRSSLSASGALSDVAAERRRQVEKEGWSHEHDDGHGDGAMAVAGACYALYAASRITTEHPSWKDKYAGLSYELWPWDEEWRKPKDTRRDLIRAAALLVAEIERLDRAATERRKASDG
jgi:hypothetical protein